MNIQSNINSVISLAGVLTTMSPSLQEKSRHRTETANVKKELTTIQEAKKAANERYEPIAAEAREAALTAQKEGRLGNLTKEEAEKMQALSRESQNVDFLLTSQIDAAKRAFMLNPSAEGYQAYIDAVRKRAEFQKQARQYEISEERGYKTRPDEMSTKAAEATAAEQERVSKSKRRFRDYIADEPVFIGSTQFGTVGSMGPAQQKAAAAAFTKSEKTEYMNRKDEENG